MTKLSKLINFSTADSASTPWPFDLDYIGRGLISSSIEVAEDLRGTARSSFHLGFDLDNPLGGKLIPDVGFRTRTIDANCQISGGAFDNQSSGGFFNLNPAFQANITALSRDHDAGIGRDTGNVSFLSDSDAPYPNPVGLDQYLANAAVKPSLSYLDQAKNLIRPQGISPITIESGLRHAPGETVVIKFGFLTHDNGTLGDHYTDFQMLNEEQQAAFIAATHVWEFYANVKFEQVFDGADANLVVGGFLNTDHPADGFGTRSTNENFSDYHGNIFLKLSDPEFSTPGTVVTNADGTTTAYPHTIDPGGRGFTTMLHELGHVLGLEHPGNYDASDAVNPSYENSATFREDNRAYTIMSYFHANYGNSVRFDPSDANFAVNPSTPELADVLAVGLLYGPRNNFEDGDTIWGWNSAGGTPLHISGSHDKVVGTIDDTDGRNTLDVSPYHEDAVIDLTQTFQSVGGLTNNITILGGSIQDVVTGSGNDSVIGDNRANTLIGGSGNDILRGGGGNDRLFGADPYDQLGDDDNNQLAGGTGTNSLFGGKGNDIFIVGQGTDYINGGDGIDMLSFAEFGPATGIVFDLADPSRNVGTPGVQHFFTKVDYTTGVPGGSIVASDTTDIEGVIGSPGNDSLYGTAKADYLYGDKGNDVIDGHEGDDVLHGDDGNDFLNGEAGNDTLSGGAGNDTLSGGPGTDKVYGDQGDDTIIAYGSTGGILSGDSPNEENGGFDTLDLSQLHYDPATVDHVELAGSQLTVFLTDGTTDHQTAERFEAVIGTSASDIVDSDAGKRTAFDGRGGDDRFTLNGVNVDRPLVVDGGDGNDTLNVAVDPGSIATINLAAGTLFITNVNFLDHVNYLNMTGTIASVENITYAGQQATITGDDGSNAIDVTVTGSDPSTVSAGGGDDKVITHGPGQVEVFGGDGNDTIGGFTLGSSFHGEGGTDTFDLSTLSPAVSGHELVVDLQNPAKGVTYDGTRQVSIDGFENVTGFQDSRNVLLGDNGDNVLIGGNQTNLIGGGEGNDTLVTYSHESSNVLNGAGGDDNVTLVRGIAYGGADTDLLHIVDFVASVPTTVQFTGKGQIGDVTFDLFERLDLQVDPSSQQVNLYGGAYDDILGGGAGNDNISGGAGSDVLSGGAGDDTFTIDSTNGHDTIDGGDGFDTLIIDLAGSNVGVVVDLEPSNGVDGGQNNHPETPAGSTIITPVYQSIESVQTKFGDGNDVIYGSSGADTINAGGGDDFIEDRSGADLIHGDAGNDRIIDQSDYGAGTDLIYGDAGNDWITIGSGSSTVYGGDGNDRIENFEFYYPTYGVPYHPDTIYGGAGNDSIQSTGPGTYDGGADTDTLTIDFSHNNQPGYVLDLRDSTAVTTLAPGWTFTNFEIYNLTFGSQADTVSIRYGAADHLDGGLGFGVTDTLNIYVDAGMTTPGYTETNDGYGHTTRTYDNGMVVSGFEKINIIGAANPVTGGPGNDTLTGTSGADYIDGGAGKDKMTGGAGDDSYVVDNTGDKVIENAGEGNDTIYTNLATYSLALLPNVENLTYTGTANFKGTGNAADNILIGGGRDDTLNGGAGADTLMGGIGNDTYNVDNVGDSVIEQSKQGTDTIISTIDLGLPDNVENLKLSGPAVKATGNALDNVITGSSLDNILDGAGGADTMIGGLGSDLYLVDNVGDVVIEAGADVDTVRTTLQSYTLTKNVEILYGDFAAGFTGTGNASANTIYGGIGDDTLDGKGGADTLAGGLGNDHYIVDNAADVIIEFAGQGDADTVYAQKSYVLGNSADIEVLIAQSAAKIDLTGNALANTIIGNDAVNHLTGGDGNDILTGNGGNDILDGGLGEDQMTGGTGNDSYYVDNVHDVVTENATEGTDAVYTTVDYRVDHNVENVTVLSPDGCNIIGNELANVLSGGKGNDSLIGGGGTDKLLGGAGNDQLDATGDTGATLDGGAGNDTLIGSNFADILKDGGDGVDQMTGGAGDDSYYVTNSLDTIVEKSGEGADTVYTSVNFVLSDNVENLIVNGTGPVSATGNGLANKLTGNNGDDILSGSGGKDTLTGGLGNDTLAGGRDADTLTGGGGSDKFVFDGFALQGDTDTIKDFEAGNDQVVLTKDTFYALDADLDGQIDAGTFTLGKSAALPGQHVIYNQATGALYYDSDGVGGAAQVQIALLIGKPMLTAHDFLVM